MGSPSPHEWKVIRDKQKNFIVKSEKKKTEQSTIPFMLRDKVKMKAKVLRIKPTLLSKLL